MKARLTIDVEYDDESSGTIDGLDRTLTHAAQYLYDEGLLSDDGSSVADWSYKVYITRYNKLPERA